MTVEHSPRPIDPMEKATESFQELPKSIEIVNAGEGLDGDGQELLRAMADALAYNMGELAMGVEKKDPTATKEGGDKLKQRLARALAAYYEDSPQVLREDDPLGKVINRNKRKKIQM